MISLNFNIGQQPNYSQILKHYFPWKIGLGIFFLLLVGSMLYQRTLRQEEVQNQKKELEAKIRERILLELTASSTKNSSPSDSSQTIDSMTGPSNRGLIPTSDSIIKSLTAPRP